MDRIKETKNYKNIVICDKCVVFLKEKSTDTEFIEMNQVKSECIT